MTTPYIGCRISLISRNDVRYEGILNGIDSVQSEVVLQNVQCFGTEDRRKDNPVQPSQDTYGFIRFRGSDIKDLHVSEFPPFHDEAMMGMQGNYGFPRGFVPQYGYGYGNPYQYNPYMQYNYDMMAQMRPMGDLPLDGMHDPQAFNMQGYPMYNYDPTGAFNPQFPNFYQQQQAATKTDSDEPPSVPKGDNQPASTEKESKPIEVTNPQDSKEKASETKTAPSSSTPTGAAAPTQKEEPATPATTTQEESAASAPTATYSGNNNNKKSGMVYQPKKKPQNQTEQPNKSSPAPVKSQTPQNNNQSTQATSAPSSSNSGTTTQNQNAPKKDTKPKQDQDNQFRKSHYANARKQPGTPPHKKQQQKDQPSNSQKQSNSQQSQQSPQVPTAQPASSQPAASTVTPSQAPQPSAGAPDSPAQSQESKGQSNKQEQGGRNGGGYRNNNRGRNHNRRRGHPSTGKFTGSDSPTTVFEEEFDFESSLAKFDKEKFVDDLNEDEKEIFLPPIPTYEKSSFFDNISCEALERESEEKVDRKTMLQQQRKLDVETFGASHAKSNRNYRGRGRSTRGGRGNHQRQDRNGDQNKIYKPKPTPDAKASSSNN